MKKSLLIALALMLVLAFASSAMAAQVLSGNSYMSTTEIAYSLPGGGSGTTVDRVYTNNKFFADGITDYPYEIYLPNEENPAAYRIHSSYTKNTDACAACHSTHTAVGGALLQWYTVYDTCMACHDGTVTTTYNVVGGKVGRSNTMAAGGMFGTGTEPGLSNHNVTGALEIAAAPGGSVVSEDLTVSGGHGKATETRWAIEFGCESCHTPHGLAGNARILHPDPNYAASQLAADNKWSLDAETASPIAGGGISATIFGTASGTGNEPLAVLNKVYFAFAPAAGTAESAVFNVRQGFTIINNREWPSQFWVKGVKVSTGTSSTSKWRFDNTLGYTRLVFMGTSAEASTIDATYLTDSVGVKVYGVPALKVTMNITNYLNQAGGATAEKVTHISGMNNYCGACHTDYNTASFEVYNAEGSFTGSSEIETGKYSKAHRHQFGRTYAAKAGLDVEYPLGVGVDKDAAGNTATIFTCLTCHVAHGTSVDYWTTSLVTALVKGPNGDLWTPGELVELAGSSALKRMPNMGTCEACHSKQIGQEGYASNSGSTVAAPLKGVVDAGQTGATFVGSENCKPCHAEQVESYRETAHSKMVTFTTAAERNDWYDKLVVEGYPHGTDTNGDWVEQEQIVLNADKTATIYSHVYKFYKQDFALNVSWNKNTVIAVCYEAGSSSYGKLCVLYENGPLKEEFENYGCITCHNTPKEVATPDWADFQAKLAAGTLEMGIQCETSGCHGPGSKHVASPSSKNIFNPGTLSIQEQSGYSFINSKGKIDTSLSKSCGLCHGSAGHNGEFWNGNKPKGFRTAGPSRMYTAGVLSCITCHTPHSNKVQDISRNGLDKADLQLKMPVRALCNGCHENRIIPVNNDNGKLRFDQYLPLKQNGMPSHLFNGQGYTNIDTTLLVKDGLVDPNGPAEEHRAE